jgi:very-short-patch-repair endonuclease
LRSTYVRGGRCDGDGQRIHNRAEAEVLVQTIRGCIEDEAYDGKTMGVIVLQGHAQAELIAGMLAAALDPQVIEERKLRCGVPATFQGDQRDVIFLSLVIAPNVQFRALNRLPDQRRFNVAMSRARDQVWLFHSVQQHDLSPECLRRRLLSFVQSPWHDASARLWEEHERLEREVLRSRRRPGEQPEPYESWFEVDVALELLRRNYRIHPQYEVAGKRIDLVVEGIENRLAVECDGDAWHGPEHYEHDMARQRQLERAGWTFVRVREAEFYSDRARVIDEIVQACGELSIRPIDQPQQVTQQGTPGEMEVEPALPTEELASTDDAIEAQTDTLEDRPTIEQGPFTGYLEALGFPDPLDASPANVRAGLRKIIEKDGPLSRASVYRLYVEGCPHRERTTKVVRQALNHVLGTMLRAGEIVQEDELGNGSPEGQVLRLAEGPRVRERLAGRRDLQEIPPSELFVALERLDFGSTGTTLDEETLLRGLLEHYGYNRLTAIRRRYLSRVLELYRANREGSDSGDVAIERRT